MAQGGHRQVQLGGALLCLLLLCTPPNAPCQETLEIVRTGTIEVERNRIVGESIEARWREYLLFGTRLEGQPNEGRYRLFDGVRLQSDALQAQGTTLELNVDTRRWLLRNGSAELRPQFLQDRLLESLYLRGEQLSGEGKQVEGRDLQATTCNLDEPHFCWHADEMTATQGDRAVLRNVRLEILGRTVLSLPTVVVPLREGLDESPLPDVGYTDEEGFYLRYAIGYLLARELVGSARLDLMQKRGVGLNLQQDFLRGDARLYYLRDLRQRTDNLTGGLTYRQNFGALQTQWRWDYRQNSYLLFANNTASDLRTDWQLPFGTGALNLSASESRNRTGSFENISRTLVIQDNRRFGALQWNLSGEYSEFENLTSGSRSGNRQWTTRANLRYGLGSANLTLDYNRFLPVGESPTFLGGLERLPEVSLVAPAEWWGLSLPDNQIRISAGRYVEGVQTRLQRDRYGFEWQGRLGTPNPRAQTATGFRWNYSFKQTFYSDDTAQYVLQSVAEQSFGLGGRSVFSLRWNYLRPYGYSPLGLDRTGFYNLLSGDLRWFVGGGWSLSAQTSYDLRARDRNRDPWSLLNLNLEYEPAPYLRWRNQFSYDPNRERLLSIQTDLLWRFGDSQLVFAGRYDAQRAKWGRLFLRADSVRWGRTRLSVLAQYNGYLNRFESRQLLLTYDLHCAELEVRYIDNPFGFRRDTGLQFFIRLKALPSFSRFGYGQLGQPVGAGGFDF